MSGQQAQQEEEANVEAMAGSDVFNEEEKEEPEDDTADDKPE